MTADATAATVALLEEELDDVDVFGSEVPDDPGTNAAMPSRTITVQPAGGIGPLDGSYVAIDGQRLELSFYAETPFRARKLAREAHGVLKAVRRQVVTYEDADESSPADVSVLVHSYVPSGGFVALREPETRWPRVLRAYVCTYAETEVTA